MNVNNQAVELVLKVQCGKCGKAFDDNKKFRWHLNDWNNRCSNANASMNQILCFKMHGTLFMVAPNELQRTLMAALTNPLHITQSPPSAYMPGEFIS